MLLKYRNKSQNFFYKVDRPIFSSLKRVLSRDQEELKAKEPSIILSAEKIESIPPVNDIMQTDRGSEKNLSPFYNLSKCKDYGVTKDALFPPFSKLDQTYIRAHTSFSLENELYSPFRWTPLIQRYKASQKFHEEMYRFSKVRNWDERHKKELVDCILYEAIRDSDFDYYYDYQCLPSKYCKFNGTADFLIYNKHAPHIPFIPVLLMKKKRNEVIKEMVEDLDIAPAVGAGIWSITNMLAVDKDIKYSRTLQTTGHKWILSEITKEGEFKKTGVYKPNNPGAFKKMYADPHAQEIILGLIRFACSIHSENELALKKAYEFIDEAKYLTELDDDTKKKLEDRKKSWRFLPESIKKFFFDYK